jgi:CRISPR-associated protein (TIGR03984 family)
MNATLSVWRPKAAITLDDGLKPVNRPLTGLCYGPNRCFFVRWKNGALEFPSDDSKNEWPRVYEARFFDADGELRWWRNPQGRGEGSAVYLSETNRGLEGWKDQSPSNGLTPVDGGYLLRGERLDNAGLPAGWYWLSSAAVGKLAVPFDFGGCAKEIRRLSLCVREYIGLAPGRAGEDGNRAVVEERWLELKCAEEPA